MTFIEEVTPVTNSRKLIIASRTNLLDAAFTRCALLTRTRLSFCEICLQWK